MLTAAPGTPELMPLDRALEITRAINDRSLYQMGLCTTVASLEQVTLREMLDAVTRVELENENERTRPNPSGGPRSFHLVPAERLIAAAYALEHYDPDSEVIVAMPGKDEFDRPGRKWLDVGVVAA